MSSECRRRPYFIESVGPKHESSSTLAHLFSSEPKREEKLFSKAKVGLKQMRSIISLFSAC